MVGDDAFGVPVARIEAEGTTILIPQALNSPRLLIHVTPRDEAEDDALVIDVADPPRHRPLSPNASSREGILS